jgi:hypothetical protein
MKKKHFITLLFLSFINLYAQQKSTAIEIGFYSECCGTPSGEEVFNYIKTFKKQNKIASIQAVLVSGLGKEREHSYILKLAELNQKQKTTFVIGLKKVLAEHQPKNNSEGGINLIENIDPNKYQELKQTKQKISW